MWMLVSTLVKGIVADGLDSVRNNGGIAAKEQLAGFLIDDGVAVVARVISGIPFLDDHACESCTFLKGVVINIGNRFGDKDTLKRRAAQEGVGVDSCQFRG